jgi:hypothetical protein
MHTYIRCKYGIFNRDITILTVIYSVRIRFSPTLRIWPYIWWFSCQKYRTYTVYIYISSSGQPYTLMFITMSLSVRALPCTPQELQSWFLTAQAAHSNIPHLPTGHIYQQAPYKTMKNTALSGPFVLWPFCTMTAHAAVGHGYKELAFSSCVTALFYLVCFEVYLVLIGWAAIPCWMPL